MTLTKTKPKTSWTKKQSAIAAVQITDTKPKRESSQFQFDDIYMILDGLKNPPTQYDDRIIRQMIECVVVESKKEIKVIFIGRLETTERLSEWYLSQYS